MISGHVGHPCRFLLARPGAEAWPGTTVDRRCRRPPVMVSIDALLIEDLDEDKGDAFAAALSS